VAIAPGIDPGIDPDIDPAIEVDIDPDASARPGLVLESKDGFILVQILMHDC